MIKRVYYKPLAWLFFFPGPFRDVRGWGQAARGRGALKVGKFEARLAPGIFLLHSAVVYTSKDDLYTSQMERKAKPIIAKPRAKILETKPKG